jgi:hypothetical protein
MKFNAVEASFGNPNEAAGVDDDVVNGYEACCDLVAVETIQGIEMTFEFLPMTPPFGNPTAAPAAFGVANGGKIAASCNHPNR